MGEIRGAYRVLWGNLRERDHLENPGVWENNIKIYLHDVGWGGKDWIYLAQDRDRWRALENVVLKLPVQ
jgi:hypothetical protein